MKTLRAILAFAFLAIGFAWALPASAQSVRGRVIDEATGEGIPGAKVTLLQGNKKIAEVLTNSRGAFALGALTVG